MLKLIAEKLEAQGLVSAAVWVEHEQHRAELVKLYREYYEGQHRLKLTKEMKSMMQINDNRLDRYNVNYSEMVVNALTDRLKIERIEAQQGEDMISIETYLADKLGDAFLPTEFNVSQMAAEMVAAFGMTETGENGGQLWGDDVLADNRFDALQLAIRQSLVIDGDTYVMSQWSDQMNQIVLAHETAFDGTDGVIVVYDRQRKNILAGVKIWWESGSQRVNIYYQDSVERYAVKTVETDDSSQIVLGSLGEPIEANNNGLSEGVPIVHFKGRSALVNVIPLQDSLNQTLLSMVMSALLAGFPFLLSLGVKVPNAQTPGMIVDILSSAVADAASSEDKELIAAVAGLMGAIKIERVEGGSLEQFIKQAEFLINQIGTITHTPLPGQMGGDTSSGEALKQREIGLLGRADTLQVVMGNSYEDMMSLAHMQQTIYAISNPPDVKRFNTVWRDAQIRNEADVRSEADWYHDKGYEREALRRLGHDERSITKLMGERTQDAGAIVDRVAGIPNFDNFEPMNI